MNFALSDEQVMLQRSAGDFVKRESSLKRIRALREDDVGFSPELWRKMAELGWARAWWTWPRSWRSWAAG